jgi:hypothetical protein
MEEADTRKQRLSGCTISMQSKEGTVADLSVCKDEPLGPIIHDAETESHAAATQEPVTRVPDIRVDGNSRGGSAPGHKICEIHEAESGSVPMPSRGERDARGSHAPLSACAEQSCAKSLKMDVNMLPHIQDPCEQLRPASPAEALPALSCRGEFLQLRRRFIVPGF